MNRNTIVTIIVIVIALAAGGYYMMSRQAAQPANTETQNISDNTNSGLTKMTLKDFMNMSGSQKCQFSDTETGSSGEVFIADGKTRGDFSTSNQGKEMKSHMINDGQNVYIWMDDQTTGFKTSLSAVEEMSKMQGTTGVSQTVDINKEVDYKCESWSADSLKFGVPVEIKFQDMGAMMKNIQGMQSMSPSSTDDSIKGSKEACGACDNLEGEQRDSCRSALKCS